MSFIFFSNTPRYKNSILSVSANGTVRVGSFFARLAKFEDDQAASVCFESETQTYFLCHWPSGNPKMPTLKRLLQKEPPAFAFFSIATYEGIAALEDSLPARKAIRFIITLEPVTSPLLPGANLYALSKELPKIVGPGDESALLEEPETLEPETLDQEALIRDAANKALLDDYQRSIEEPSVIIEREAFDVESFFFAEARARANKRHDSFFFPEARAHSNERTPRFAHVDDSEAGGKETDSAPAADFRKVSASGKTIGRPRKEDQKPAGKTTSTSQAKKTKAAKK